MALEVLTQIKAAEEKALDTRRTAAAAAKDSLKLAVQENDEIKDKELTEARRQSLAVVDAAQQAAKKELEALKEERIAACQALKAGAEKKLGAAADVCIERILNSYGAS
jgi:vacuolar-type H+-ATPase subunit H